MHSTQILRDFSASAQSARTGIVLGATSCHDLCLSSASCSHVSLLQQASACIGKNLQPITAQPHSR